MDNVRICPVCKTKMEYDDLTDRFVCGICGGSESAPKGAETPLEDPVEILRSYAESFQCKSVSEVLTQAETVKTELYLTQISSHPALTALSKAIPGSSLPHNIADYCETAKELFATEERIRKAEKEIKKAEAFARGWNINDRSNGEKINWDVLLAVLAAPMVRLLKIVLRNSLYFHVDKQTLNSLFHAFLLLDALVIVYLIISKIVKRIKIRTDDPVRRSKSVMKDLLEKLYKIQEKKEKILREIQSEETKINEKYKK